MPWISKFTQFKYTVKGGFVKMSHQGLRERHHSGREKYCNVQGRQERELQYSTIRARESPTRGESCLHAWKNDARMYYPEHFRNKSHKSWYINQVATCACAMPWANGQGHGQMPCARCKNAMGGCNGQGHGQGAMGKVPCARCHVQGGQTSAQHSSAPP